MTTNNKTDIGIISTDLLTNEVICIHTDGSVDVMTASKDEVGNVRSGHKFTGVNYDDYFKNIVESEGKECKIYPWHRDYDPIKDKDVINCCLHDFERSKKINPKVYTLTDFCKDKCKYGLLGSNKSTEEKLKLFPNYEDALDVCNKVKSLITII